MAFVGLVGAGLLGYGEREKKKKRAARLAAKQGASSADEPPTGPEDGAEGT